MTTLIDVSARRESLEVGRLSAKARGNGAASATISEPMPDNDVAIASGRLKARKSVSGIGTQDRETAARRGASACARVRRRVAVCIGNGAELLGHRIGGLGALRRLFGKRSTDHAVHRSDGGRANECGRLFAERAVQDLDDVLSLRTPGGRRASRRGWPPLRTRSLRASTPRPLTCSGAM